MNASLGVARLFAAALIAAGLLAGCATFRASKRVDVGPFAENTMGMVGELQKFNRPVMWTYLKKYQSLPSVKQAQQSVGRIRVLLRGVAMYSMQVAALQESPLPEQRKISELARYMDEIIRPGLVAAASSDIRVTPGYMDTLIRNIRARDTFLSALGAAQPLVAMTVSAGDMLFSHVDEDVQAAAADINARIEEEFGPLRLRVGELDDMHVASIRSYTLLQSYRGGDQTALDSLRLIDRGIRDFMPSGRPPTTKELDSAERYVIDRTTTIKSLRDQLEPEFTIYKAHQDELEMLRNQADVRARLGRATLFLWGRSHRNLAAGIGVPPMIDVVGIMKSTVSTGVKGIVP